MFLFIKYNEISLSLIISHKGIRMYHYVPSDTLPVIFCANEQVAKTLGSFCTFLSKLHDIKVIYFDNSLIKSHKGTICYYFLKKK